jgi:putative phosphoesterase
MLIAFISDVHGNMPALESAVADATTHGAERIVCSGDMTGYGPFPDDVCHFLQNRQIPAVIGNYDRKALTVAKQGFRGTDLKSVPLKSKKRKILLWTVEHLGHQSQLYLSGLPDQFDMQLPSGHELIVVHGSTLSLDDVIYPSITRPGLTAKLGDLSPDILVCGHTHIPFVRRIGGILVVNCGSAGQPIDGDPRPSYALVTTAKGALPQGRIIRFDYDRQRTIAALAKTSLPKGLRKDLADGSKRRFLS